MTGVVDLLAICLAGVFVGLLAVVLVDGAFALFGAGRFGRASGWLAAVLPLLLLMEEFRAWRGARGRILVAVVGLAVAIPLGMIAAGLTRYLPPLFSGAVGATIAVVAYATVWFYGVRRLQ